jgi:hypothetical protein
MASHTHTPPARPRPSTATSEQISSAPHPARGPRLRRGLTRCWWGRPGYTGLARGMACSAREVTGPGEEARMNEVPHRGHLSRLLLWRTREGTPSRTWQDGQVMDCRMSRSLVPGKARDRNPGRVPLAESGTRHGHPFVSPDPASLEDTPDGLGQTTATGPCLRIPATPA